MKKMVKEGITYEKIGKTFGISKQRVHQLIKNYGNAPWNSKKWRILHTNPCEVCRAKKVEIHHRDGDRNNNDMENLQPLCKKHHVEAEKILREIGIKTWNYTNRGETGKFISCKICKVKVWRVPSKINKNTFCSQSCKSAFEKGRKLKRFVHGTLYGYSSRKCRCDLCKEENTERCRKYREKYREKIKVV